MLMMDPVKQTGLNPCNWTDEVRNTYQVLMDMTAQ